MPEKTDSHYPFHDRAVPELFAGGGTVQGNAPEACPRLKGVRRPNGAAGAGDHIIFVLLFFTYDFTIVSPNTIII